MMPLNSHYSPGLKPQEAETRIRDFTRLLPPVLEPLAGCEQRVLREAIYAPAPFPAADRVCMDGIAVRWAAGQECWRHAGRQYAGDRAKELPALDAAIEVATGAICPSGADTVIPYESLRDAPSDAEPYWELRPGTAIAPGKNIQRRGSEQAHGQLLLEPFSLLRAPELCLLAAIGKAVVPVSRKPRISLISNGTELVPIAAEPLPHQRRECNNAAAAACLLAFRYEAIQSFHAPDHVEALAEILQGALRSSDVVVCSGGISQGPRDLLRDRLCVAGITEVFYQIAQKPGRPLWFGVGPGGQLVFALPGNPVAALMNLRRYVLPALAQMEGRQMPLQQLHLDTSLQLSKAEMLPVRIEPTGGGSAWARPLPYRGSGDFTSLAGSDGFVALEAGAYERGALVAFYGWTP